MIGALKFRVQGSGFRVQGSGFSPAAGQKNGPSNRKKTSFIKEADYAGIYSGKNEDKFKALGLTPVKSDVVNAPYIKEFPVVLECEVLKVVEIGLHIQFIGEINDIKADENILAQNGLPDISKVKPFIYNSTGQDYYALGDLLGRAYTVGRKE